MSQKFDRVAFRCHIHAIKEEAINLCLDHINIAVRTNQPDIKELADKAYHNYARILILEKYIKKLGCGTIVELKQIDHSYDNMTYEEMLERLDPDVVDIIEQKGIELK